MSSCCNSNFPSPPTARNTPLLWKSHIYIIGSRERLFTYWWNTDGVSMECMPVVRARTSACMFAYKKCQLRAFVAKLKRKATRDKPSNVLDVTQLPSRKLVLSFVTASGCLALMAEWSWVAYTVLEVLIAAACCFGNVLVMCAVCFGIRDSLREPTFCFLVSLAVADFLVGVAAVPLAVLLDGWVSLIPELCLLLSCVVLVLTQASVLSLLAIAVDRYLRLHTPLRWGELWVSCFVSEHCDIFRFSLLLCFIPLSDTKPWPHKGTHGSACLFAGCFHVSLASLLYSAGTITPPQHLILPTHLPLLSSVRRALSSQLSPSLSWSTSTFSDVSWHPCWSWPSSTLESFGAYRDV